MLLGRAQQQAALANLLDAARQGRSGATVLRGEAGVGKTALLDDLVAAASDIRVVRVAGVESERELPFAALHQLCGPLLDRLDRLPEPQQEALGTTFGLRAGAAPNPLFVGLAVLTLVSEVAADRPLLCVVDDAQWLDRASAQTLGFVARRLVTESVLMVFAVREQPGPAAPVLGDLPALPVEGLGERDARALLASVAPWPLDSDVRDAILAEARGNPLALLELPARVSPVDLAGGFALPEALPLPVRIEESFRRRIGDLTAPARLLLLLAAADPVGDPAILWQAAERLGVSRDAGDELEEAGLLHLGLRAAFRHPLVRSAAYRTAEPEERRRAHAALAEATDPVADPDRRAWHRAQATSGPDEAVATELEASADRARARGGLAAAAAFLERAADLTEDPGRRAERELAAARETYRAGSPEVATRLLARASAGPDDEVRDARIDLLRGQMAFASADSVRAPGLLVDAARRFERLDPGRARDIYLEAFAAANFVGRFAEDAGLPEVAAAVRAAPPAAREPRLPDLLLDGLATLFTDGFPAGAPPVRRALAQFDVDDLAVEESIHWPHTVCAAANSVFDDAAWHAITSAYLRLARGNGELTGLSYILHMRIGLHLHQGEVAQAAVLADEIDAVIAATGRPSHGFAPLVVAGWRGDEQEVLRLRQATADGATDRREGTVFTIVQVVLAVLYNGLGRYAEAYAAASQAASYELETGFANWALVELVEAAARAGDLDGASRGLARLAERTTACGTDWALGVEARSRALLVEGGAAEPLYREAIDRLSKCRGAFPLARAHLVYGEWLRRENRRVDARSQLRTAYEMFVSFGTDAFADRARRELAACGEIVRSEAPAAVDLTPQERQIARRARDGQSNPEIAAELFLSARTVEWHLRKVFGKLGITSRRDLRTALPG
ncbi:AAA family ATPase [Actinoplanes sp. CA-142083]|uniref:AAA family ATPase n=1 Tax=Actinoplanes sp. CA-142083 TaxID=3239903 RepID=UPI003D8AD275